ncbi:MAG: hypothetical protein ACRDOC_11885 [Streptosporangiaceae bacterium]
MGNPIRTGGGTTELTAARRAAERAVGASVDGATGGGPLVVEMVVLTAS